MRLAICALLMTTAATQAALAQTCAPPVTANAAPILHLAETATIKVAPSLLVADLVASADTPIAVTAQRRVNGLMAQASGLAGKVSGVQAVFQDYSTSFVDRANGVPAHWLANQTLEVRSTDSEALLTLVGQLGGFLLPSLTGSAAQAGGLPAAIGALAVVHLLLLVPALSLRDTRGPARAPAGAVAAS